MSLKNINHHVRLFVQGKTAVLVLGFWWIFWAGVATSRNKNLFPAPAAINLVVLWCLGLILGFIAFQKLGGDFLAQAPSVSSFRIFRRQFLALFVPTFLGSIWILYKAIYFIFIQGLSFPALRASFFDYGASGVFWFPSKYLWSLFLILSGTTFQFLLIWTPSLLLRKDKWILWPLLFIVGVQTFALASRGLLYAIVLMMLFQGLLRIVMGRRIPVLASKIGKRTFLMALIAMSFTSFLRGHSVLVNGSEYHSVGFTLLSNVVEKRAGWEGDSLNWGRLSFGGLDYLFTIVVRGLGVDPHYTSPAYESSKIEMISVPTNEYENEPSLTWSNAYYTILSSPFRDFGEIGVLIFGIVISYFLCSFERSYIQYGSLESLAWLSFLMHNCLMGLFGASLETQSFWIVLILLLFATTNKTLNFDFLRKADAIWPAQRV